MHIRRFQAPTLLEAVQQVKAALGPDALVLETRTVRKGEGWFGLMGRSLVEVTAAVDRDSASEAPPAPGGSARPAAAVRAGQPGDEREPSEGASRRAEGAEPERLAPLHAGQAALTREVRALRSRLERLGQQDPERTEMLRELAELRSWTAELARGRAPEAAGPVETRLAGRLLASGLAPRHAWRLGREAAERPEVTRTERAALAAVLRANLDDRMHPPRADDGVEVEVLVGPTGVGKTTTLAKLAAREQREHGGVALLTMDVHRMGAVEQLQRYAGAIDAPFGVAADADALAELIEARPARRVLVDTAGRGGPIDAVDGLCAVRQAAGRRARVSLVLSATADSDQLRFERARYAPVAPDALILTKLDECASWSAATNLVLDEEAPPLLWMTAGQRVPEDLTVPEPDAFAEALLRSREVA